MARFTLGATITDITGSMGGTTFSKNRAGNIMKNRAIGKRGATTKQSLALQANNNLIAEWNNLTNIEKDVWNAYSLANTLTNRWGEVKTLTGYNWYQLINNASRFDESGQQVAPPAFAIPVAFPSLSAVLDATKIELTWSVNVDPNVTGLMLYSSSPNKSNAVFNRGQYRLLDIVGIDFTSVFDVTTAWSDAFNIDYLSLSAESLFNLSFLAVPFNKTSFVTGVAASTVGTFIP